MDPVLKGTSYGAALEAAERDEQAKRDKRAAETRGLRPQARLIADAMRGHLPPPPPVTHPTQTQETSSMTATATHPYSEAQLNILAMGLEADNARVPKGTAIKRLFDEGLAVRTTDHHYKTTDKGRETWTSLAAAPKATPTPATSPTNVQGGVEVAALHLQLQQTTQLANDRGARIEGLLDRIEELKRQLEQATTAATQSPAESEGQAQEIETLKQTIHSLEHQILTLNASLDAIAPLMDEDKSDLPLVMYVQQLRDTIKTHQSDQAAAPDLSIMLDAVLATSYNTDIADLERIRDLQAADGQSHLSILGYLVGLRDFRSDASPATADPITLAIGEAARQAHKQADTTLSVGDWLRDLIKKAASLDQAAGQIEALRRCIEDLETQLTVRTQELREVKRHDLAAAILDDLCHLIPAVEEYRAGREQADQALDALRRR